LVYLIEGCVGASWLVYLIEAKRTQTQTHRKHPPINATAHHPEVAPAFLAQKTCGGGRGDECVPIARAFRGSVVIIILNKERQVGLTARRSADRPGPARCGGGSRDICVRRK
jgi:hypothetical protein